MKKAFVFKTPLEFDVGISRLAKVLDFEIGKGTEVFAVKGEYNGVSLADGRATISYTEKHFFFRELGVLAERIGGDFSHTDDGYFKELGIMLDCSRGSVPRIETLFSFIDRLALMGYGTAMLYTEDTYELDGYPFFGYMRGRYSKDELRAIDDYAYGYGIEIVPCIECYGHMERYLRWAEAAPIKDTERILLAREEKTFSFIRDMLSQVTSCFRTRRVHIGMDEAHGMGRGKFMDKNGFVPAFEIFNEYMERLVSITDSLGLYPMMWSDMYFRVSSKRHAYYDKDTVLPPEVLEKIPKNIELVFWHYGEEPQCDKYMLEKHKAIGNEIVFAGGAWSWNAHFPENNYMMESSRFSLDACRAGGVRRAMQTVWFDDNAECDMFASLAGLSFFAELCYNPEVSEEELASRFFATTGGIREGFLTMSLYHNSFDDKNAYVNEKFHERFFGKAIFYQDLMQGLFDSSLYSHPMSEHYERAYDKMCSFTGGEWAYLYDFARLVFKYLYRKAWIHEHLVPAYRASDSEMLARIANWEIPALKDEISAVHRAHREIWHKNYKPFGWRNLEDRYGGLICRCDTAAMRLSAYLCGECETLPELDEARLTYEHHGFMPYTEMVV